MKVPRSVLAALIIFLALLSYFGVRTLARAAETGKADEAAASASAKPEKLIATIRVLRPEPHAVIASLKGRTEAERVVTVRAETSGSVARAPAEEGALVKKGALLCGLSVDARQARVAEAQAAVDARWVEYKAAAELVEKGWTSTNSAASAKAALDSAQAALNSAKVELARTRIVAPFDGVFETRLAETGDYLSPGGGCGVLVDLDPLVVALDLPAETATRMRPGQSAEIALPNGAVLPASVRYVARTADNATRTFHAEVATPNPDYALSAGISVSVKAKIGEADAVRLTPAALVLNDAGEVGVRHVDDANTVRFSKVTIIDDDENGVWAAGLPDPVRLLAEGQEFLREGAEVDIAPVEGS